ncbi:hypothetical protein BpHYR1_003583 [Brachionus plicatilis]|uniref:Uncharacterized protein n=1 Tax=Brachionus plicatilis TaxID=10195 RepID=A0A3M7SYR0_BRAPC|nr:hypothetical protein BpHYR1_003583 [Brachionus plicatilis]
MQLTRWVSRSFSVSLSISSGGSRSNRTFNIGSGSSVSRSDKSQLVRCCCCESLCSRLADNKETMPHLQSNTMRHILDLKKIISVPLVKVCAAKTKSPRAKVSIARERS